MLAIYLSFYKNVLLLSSLYISSTMCPFTLKEVVTCREEKILIYLGSKWLSENSGKLFELSFSYWCNIKLFKCAFIIKGWYCRNGSFWKHQIIF